MTDPPRTPVQRLERLADELRKTKPNQLFDLATDKLLRLFGPRFTSKLRIFRYDPLANCTRWPKEFALLRFSRFQDLPTDRVAEMSTLGFDSVLAANFGQGADLWLGIGREGLAISLWTVRRARLREWHLSIEPDDLILYSVVTQPTFRGLGLAGAAAAEIWRREGNGIQTFYVDCAL